MPIPTWVWWSLLGGLVLAGMLAIAVSIIKDTVEDAVKRAMWGVEDTVRSAVQEAMDARDWDEESKWEEDDPA